MPVGDPLLKGNLVLEDASLRVTTQLQIGDFPLLQRRRERRGTFADRLGLVREMIYFEMSE
jgi:hypothetical protein